MDLKHRSVYGLLEVNSCRLGRIYVDVGSSKGEAIEWLEMGF